MSVLLTLYRLEIIHGLSRYGQPRGIKQQVVTEAVFTYPGLGRLLIQAISTRDYPLLQGCILVILVAYMLINLTVDMLYAWIDPRIEYR